MEREMVFIFPVITSDADIQTKPDEGWRSAFVHADPMVGKVIVSYAIVYQEEKNCNKNMAPRREPHPTPHDHKSHTGDLASPDKDRHKEEDKHHPLDHPHPHPEHHPQKKAALPPRHNPHTPPPEQALDTDHGSHQDRPRPAKIAMKDGKTGAKVRKK